MFNNVILIGRTTEDAQIRRLETGQALCTLGLAVTRAFKNSAGEYDVDFINVSVWDPIAESTYEFCGKGSIIAIKGRLVAKKVEFSFSKEEPELKKTINILDVYAERVIFISTKSRNQTE